jgi:ketosteroid isomerase-like protein
MSAQDNARLIQTLIDAYNAKNIDRYAAISTDDFEVLLVPRGRTFKGPVGHRQFVEGKVASIHYYYDLLSVLQQLGLVPTKSGELVPIS